MTPYEKFLRESLEEEKRLAIQLNEEYEKAGQFRKAVLKRKLDQVNQNIVLLSIDLKNYASGMNYLREPSKERDEKAESLKPVPVEAITGAAAKPAPSAAQPRTTPQVGTPSPSAPTVGRPVSAPSVGRPVSAVPRVGTPPGQPPTQSQTQTPPKPPVAPPSGVAPRVGAPMIGKPVAPRVGTPVGTAKKDETEVKTIETTESGGEKSNTSTESQSA